MKEIKSLTFIEKRSKFYAYCYHIDNEEEIIKIKKELIIKHNGYKHILYAARFKNKFSVYVSEASEDREPVSSMKKTRDLLERKDIKDILIIIVRYYGGTNLGASNLDHIYFTLATNLLSAYNNREVN